MTNNANQNPSKTVSPMQDRPGSSPIVTPPEHERHKSGQAQPGRSPDVQPSEREPQHKPAQTQPGNSPTRQS